MKMGEDVYWVINDCVFIWDSEKADSNIKKHEVSFQEAAEVFFDPLYQWVEDARVEGEQRWRLTGYSKSNRPLVVVSTEQGVEAWRIISARELTSRERYEYEEENDSD
jgi:uncharacterized protein